MAKLTDRQRGRINAQEMEMAKFSRRRVSCRNLSANTCQARANVV